MPVQHEVDQLAGCAGDQLQQSHAGIQRVVEQGPGIAGAAHILQQMAILHHRQIGIVHAGKGVEALGAGLAGARAQNHLAVEHDLYAAAAPAGIEEGIRQIALGVGAVEPDGLLRTGKHDGLGTALHQIAEGGGGVGHGVGAVGDDKAVVAVVPVADGGGEAQPVLRPDVGAVQRVQLETFHPAEVRDAGDEGQQLLRGQLRRQAGGRLFRGNGAAGADHQDLFHGHTSRSSMAASPKAAACSVRRRDGGSSPQAACSCCKNSPRRESSPHLSHSSCRTVVLSRTCNA